MTVEAPSLSFLRSVANYGGGYPQYQEGSISVLFGKRGWELPAGARPPTAPDNAEWVSHLNIAERFDEGTMQRSAGRGVVKMTGVS